MEKINYELGYSKMIGRNQPHNFAPDPFVRFSVHFWRNFIPSTVVRHLSDRVSSACWHPSSVPASKPKSHRGASSTSADPTIACCHHVPTNPPFLFFCRCPGGGADESPGTLRKKGTRLFARFHVTLFLTLSPPPSHRFMQSGNWYCGGGVVIVILSSGFSILSKSGNFCISFCL